MSSNSIYSFEGYDGYDYDNYYSDFDDEYYMSDDDDDDDDDDDNHTYNFFNEQWSPQSGDPPFLECKKLKDYLDNGTFSDVIIIVEDKKYHLHRVILSLKSAYFQKLFAQNFIEHKQKEIELKCVDVPVFDCIVKFMYENDLESSITSDNMTKLLIALDYLQIEIDQTWFSRRMQNSSEAQMVDLFELFNFLVFHSAYPWLLMTLLKYFSKNLVKISKTEYFTSIPFEYLKKILLCMHVKIDEEDEPRYITKICAKWICGDFDNRSGHIVEIVNAVKYRYSKMFFLIDKNYDINCSESDDKVKEQYIEKKLEKLLNYSVEFIPAACAESFVIRNEETSVGPKNTINVKQQMQELLNSGDLSDVCIKVSNKSFRVHRAILASKSTFFYNLFTAVTDDNSNEHEMEDMDEITFKLILNYIYFEELEITPKENVVFLIKASERFEMKELFKKIEDYILEKISEIENIFELFAYLRTCTYTKLLVCTEKYILDNWCAVPQKPDFVHLSTDKLENILSLSNVFAQDESEIVKLCSKWIMYDLDNRLPCVPSLISSLCRTMLTDVECSTHIENLKNSSSEKMILQNLNKLLCCLNPVNAIKPNEKTSFEKPLFVASSGNTLNFFACSDGQNLEELEDLRLVIPNESLTLSAVCATILDTNLFVQFNDNYFYAQNLVTKRCVSLTTDQASSHPWRSQLLSCNESLYLCHNDEGKILRYSIPLNRWLKVPAVDPTIKRNTQAIYACNEKSLFSISTERREHSFSVHKYDENTKSWSKLPDVIDTNRAYETPISAGFLNQNLFVAFGSFSKTYNFRNRRWTTIILQGQPSRDFLCVKHFQNNKFFYVDKNKISIYDATKKNWTEVHTDDSRKLTYLNVIHST